MHRVFSFFVSSLIIPKREINKHLPHLYLYGLSVYYLSYFQIQIRHINYISIGIQQVNIAIGICNYQFL